jgi:hypothetical protein
LIRNFGNPKKPKFSDEGRDPDGNKRRRDQVCNTDGLDTRIQKGEKKEKMSDQAIGEHTHPAVYLHTKRGRKKNWAARNAFLERRRNERDVCGIIQYQKKVSEESKRKMCSGGRKPQPHEATHLRREKKRRKNTICSPERIEIGASG